MSRLGWVNPCWDTSWWKDMFRAGARFSLFSSNSPPTSPLFLLRLRLSQWIKSEASPSSLLPIFLVLQAAIKGHNMANITHNLVKISWSILCQNINLSLFGPIWGCVPRQFLHYSQKLEKRDDACWSQSLKSSDNDCDRIW